MGINQRTKSTSRRDLASRAIRRWKLACRPVPHYKSDFREDDFAGLKAAIEQVGKAGPFNANDVLVQVLGVTDNAGDVATILEDLSDLDYLTSLGGEPPRWELARGITGT